MDAGFIEGDEVSSNYDPMIAKLIVQGATREIAIQKLQAALDEYEIAGPTTNIEFLKAVCRNQAFAAGEVETGFIPKRRDELFEPIKIVPEIFAQAAVGSYLADTLAIQPATPGGLLGMGFSATQSRDFRFISSPGTSSIDATETAVTVQSIGTGLFNIVVNGTTTFQSVTSRWNSETRTLTSYFPHTRLDTRLILGDSDSSMTLFQQGQQYRLKYATPGWIEKALGVKANAHSVLAPMPCKILRVQVKEGEKVNKDQPLVVIESMKMETVIRSPQDGVVSRIVHQQGVSCWNVHSRNSYSNDYSQDLCKAGTALVEFEEPRAPDDR